MKRVFNILDFGKKLAVLLAILLCLSACDKNPQISPMDAGNTNAQDQVDVDQQAKDHRTCWQEGVLTAIYDVTGKTVMAMYGKLTAGATNLIMVGFAVWFAFKLLKFLGSVAEQNIGQIWNEVLKKLFLCLFCAYLASSTAGLKYALNSFVFPIYNAFLELGGEILEASTQSLQQTTAFRVLGEELNVGEYSLVCKPSADMSVPDKMDRFPDSPRVMMNCMICAIASRLSLGIKVSFEVMKSWDLTQAVIGLLVWGCFVTVYLSFVFYLVDTLFKLSLMILLLPIFIMAYPFEQTRKWTTTGFKSIMNSAVFVMIIAIMISMALSAMVELISGYPQIFDSDYPEASFREFSVALVCLLLIGFLVFGSLKLSNEVAGAIIGGKTQTNFEKNLRALVGVLWSFTGGKLLRAAGNSAAMKKLKQKAGVAQMQNFNAKLQHLAGHDKDRR